MSAEDALQLAAKELKRADHSIAVSLKYTRTVDVIKGIVQRLINTVGFCLDTLLEDAKAQKKIDEIPSMPRMRVDIVKKTFFEDELITNFCDFYLLLRRVDKADFQRAQEYRRHVTMTAHLDTGESIELTIDIITDYFERTKEFLNHVSRLVNESE